MKMEQSGLVLQLMKIPNKTKDIHSANFKCFEQQVNSAFEDAVFLGAARGVALIEKSIIEMANAGYSTRAQQIAETRYPRFIAKYYPASG